MSDFYPGGMHNLPPNPRKVLATGTLKRYDEIPSSRQHDWRSSSPALDGIVLLRADRTTTRRRWWQVWRRP